MINKSIFYLIFTALLFAEIHAQTRDYELGSQSFGTRYNRYGGFYDYSDPTSVNIKVSVWGFVKYPGRYMIPEYSSIIDLFSYVGGPTDDSNLDELRLYRVDENNKEIMIPFDLNDLVWEKGLKSKKKNLPKLKPSDILVVPGEPRLYFMDWFSIGLSIFSALISLTILVLTIQKK